VPLIRAGDTLLSEAALGAGPAESGGVHLTAKQAGGAATRGGATKLILTHILDARPAPEARAAAQKSFDGEIEVAEPGLEVDVR
jgi:ribonuclease BN (tRNA processing enzyme)